MPARRSAPIGWGAVVVMVSGAVTLLPSRFAVADGQVASVMAAGSAQVMLISPRKLSTATRVTVAVPDCPGAVMVTFGIGVEMLKVVSRTVTGIEYALCVP